MKSISHDDTFKQSHNSESLYAELPVYPISKYESLKTWLDSMLEKPNTIDPSAIVRVMPQLQEEMNDRSMLERKNMHEKLSKLKTLINSEILDCSNKILEIINSNPCMNNQHTSINQAITVEIDRTKILFNPEISSSLLIPRGFNEENIEVYTPNPSSTTSLEKINPPILSSPLELLPVFSSLSGTNNNKGLDLFEESNSLSD